MPVARIGLLPIRALRSGPQSLSRKAFYSLLRPHRFPNARATPCYRSGRLYRGHLVADLLREGNEVRAVDIKALQEWYQLFPEAENLQLDLCGKDACERAVRDISLIYNLAADMGGMGFIENNKARCMLSVLVSTHMLMMAKEAGVSRFFYSSSACVYAADKQTDPNVTALKEEDAYPAMPEDGYGWEKLFSERMCRHFREDC